MSRNAGEEPVWIVVLEVAATQRGLTLDSTGFERLVSSWGTPGSTALYSPDCYALQARVSAASAPIALSSAISRWQDAVQRAGLPQWVLVRAELMTPEEFDRELAATDWRPLQESAQVVYRLVSDSDE